jgi:hypothetical protein
VPTAHRFTVEDYYRMAESGILDRDARVELIEGVIVDMPPIGPEHGGTVDKCVETFVLRYHDVAHVRTQNPVRLDQFTEPQPDLALLRRRHDSYRLSHPTPVDTLLVVEIADSSLRFDRSTKVPIYSRLGIPEVWVVDVANRLVHIYRDPSSQGYRVVSVARPGERIAPLAFPDRPIEVSDLLG